MHTQAHATHLGAMGTKQTGRGSANRVEAHFRTACVSPQRFDTWLIQTTGAVKRLNALLRQLPAIAVVIGLRNPLHM